MNTVRGIVKRTMKGKSTRYALAPPFLPSPVLRLSPLLTFPSAWLWNSCCLLGADSTQTVLAMLAPRTAPSDVSVYPRGSRNASLRKDGTRACLLYFKIIALPAGRTFPESRLVSTVGHPLEEDERSEGQSALSECEARVRRLSEASES
jgi:hypothetical protein